MAFDTQDNSIYLVLANGEEQYSLWPKYNPIPAGWKWVAEGTRAECLSRVDELWKDMRPLSLRLQMDNHSA